MASRMVHDGAEKGFGKQELGRSRAAGATAD
jgi:hypothetical protein